MVWPVGIGIIVLVMMYFGFRIIEELQKIRDLLSLIQCDGVGKHPGQSVRA